MNLQKPSPPDLDTLSDEWILRLPLWALRRYSEARFSILLHQYSILNREMHVMDKNTHLTKLQQFVLSFGLKFIPPAVQRPVWERSNDLWFLGRRILLQLAFKASGKTLGGLPWYKKQNATPASLDKGHMAGFKAFSDSWQWCVRKKVPIEVLTAVRTAVTDSISFTQSFYDIPSAPPLFSLFNVVLSQLKANNDIVITPADKNLGICVASNELYLRYLAKELSDVETYARIECKFEDMLSGIERLAQLLGEIRPLNSRDERGYYDHVCTSLMNDVNTYRLPLHVQGPVPLRRNAINMYLLWKVHKVKLATRPISPVINYPTAYLCRVINRWLQPAMKSADSYVRDSSHFQQLITRLDNQRTLSGEVLLIAGDIQSLYPNVDTSEMSISMVVDYACEVNQRLASVPADIIAQVAIWLKSAIRFVLDNHFVQAPDGSTYKQISGLAMGVSFAPPFACIWLAILEKPLVTLFAQNLRLYKRYIDDLMIIWEGSRALAMEFCSQFNQLHRRLQVPEWTVSTSDAVFLDLVVIHQDGRLLTDLFVKPTNKGLFLPLSSLHQSSTFSGWVRCEFVRRLTKCQLQQRRIQHCTSFIAGLLLRGYSLDFCLQSLRDAVVIVMKQETTSTKTPLTLSAEIILDPWGEYDTITAATTSSEVIFPFVTTFCDQTDKEWSSHVRKLFTSTFDILRDEHLFDDPRILVAFRNANPLSKSLRSKSFTKIGRNKFTELVTKAKSEGT
jgi:hypothetical protein